MADQKSALELADMGDVSKEEAEFLKKKVGAQVLNAVQDAEGGVTTAAQFASHNNKTVGASVALNAFDGLEASKEPETEGGEQAAAPPTLGTWDGVFISCVLNIFGVIMYLRLGWCVGQAGIILGIAIILVAGMVVCLTTLSMSAIATNGVVKAGGAYYMISRALGPAVGGSIGVLFAIGNGVAIALYIVGFCETLIDNLGLGRILGTANACADVDGWADSLGNTCATYVSDAMCTASGEAGSGWDSALGAIADFVDTTNEFSAVEACCDCGGGIINAALYTNEIRIYGTALLCFLTLMALGGVDWVVKLNMGLLTIIMVSIVLFILGAITREGDPILGYTGLQDSQFSLNLGPDYTESYDFFSVFSVFFPAVTGIMAGANISDKLIDPSVAIPVGTLSAVIGCSIIYVGLAILIGSAAERWALVDNTLIMANICLWPPIVYIGVYAATFSSALASLVGSPRILNAVAKDHIIPAIDFFAKTDLKGEPKRAYIFAFVIALGCVLIGDLNVIAPLISMFFMMTYALINFSCFELSRTKSPGWRPAFHYYTWYTALFGCVACIVCMFLTDALSAVLSALIGFGLYKYIAYRNPPVDWGSAIEAVQELNTLKQLLRMKTHGRNAKNFRPQYLVLTQDGTMTDPLVNFVTTLRHGNGGTIYGKVVIGNLEDSKARDSIGKFCLENRPATAVFGYLEDPDAVPSTYDGDIIKVALGNINDLLDDDEDKEQDEPVISQASSAFIAPGGEGKGKSRTTRVLSDAKEVPAPIADAIEATEVMDSADGDDVLILKKNAFLDVVLAQNFRSGARMLIQASGLGAIRPNTVVFGYQEDWKNKDIKKLNDYVGAVRESFFFNMNTMVIRGHKELDYAKEPAGGSIDIWWLVEDGGVTVLVPYIISQHRFWKDKHGSSYEDTTMRLLVIVNAGTAAAEKDELREKLEHYMSKLRFANWTVECVEKKEEPEKAAVLVYNNVISKTKLEDQPQNLQRRTKTWLLFADTIETKSRGAKLVVVTIPYPRSHFDPFIYMSWLELLTTYFKKNGVPVLLMRGNGINVLTV